MVATPIGNLSDLSPRALSVLGGVHSIAAEDTRHTGQLLAHFGIATPMIALHEHNEREAVPALIERLRAGEAVALVSDAGTPLISDPGFHLVRAAHQEGVRVLPIPGPSAVVSALSVSGLPSVRFAFEGFLPAGREQRLKRLAALARETRTLIFFEAPHRILTSLADMSEVFGPMRQAVIARELTKRFETVITGTLQELLARLQDSEEQRRGELVVLVEGAAEPAEPEQEEVRRVLSILLRELPLKQAVNLAAQITGAKKNAVYGLALKLTDNSERVPHGSDRP